MGKPMKLYSCTSTENFINLMIEKGYEAIQLREGVLGVGDWILLSHDERKYNFNIRERFINEWSSGQSIRRIAKISKALQEEIEKAM